MSVVSVREVGGPAGSVSFDETTFRREFIVTFSDAAAINADAALTASDGTNSVPSLSTMWGNTVTGRRTPWVKSVTSKMESGSSQKIWRVSVVYSNSFTRLPPRVADPWDQDPVYSSGAIEYEVAFERDYTSPTPQQVRNSAGDPFDPLPGASHINRRISVQVNTQNFSESALDALINTVNDSAVEIRGVSYPAGKLRLLRWEVSGSSYINAAGAEKPYYVNNLDFESSTFDHWHDLKILNQGYREKDAEGKLKRIMDNSSPPKPVPQPSLLAADGTKLADGAEPVYLTFKQFPSANWSVISALGI
jgi:hypothetical protein